MNDQYDIVIIGAGEAGQAAAHLARRGSASVAIIDRELFGGSCPFWACIASGTCGLPLAEPSRASGRRR